MGIWSNFLDMVEDMRGHAKEAGHEIVQDPNGLKSLSVVYHCSSCLAQEINKEWGISIKNVRDCQNKLEASKMASDDIVARAKQNDTAFNNILDIVNAK